MKQLLPKALLNFETMAYSEEASIAVYDKFIAEFGDEVMSITDGYASCLHSDESRSSTCGPPSKEYKITIQFLQDFDGILPLFLNEPYDTSDAESSVEQLREPKRGETSLPFFLTKQNERTFCVAESFASNVPFWQIEKYDLPLWKKLLKKKDVAPISKTPSSGSHKLSCKPILFPVSSENGTSTTQRLLSLLLALKGEDKRIVIFPIESETTCSVEEYIPLMRLIDEINDTKIWKSPIDLLLIRDISYDLVKLPDQDLSSFLVWNPETILSWPSTLSVSLFSGVFPSNPYGKCIQYILDSTGDVESSVDGITTDMWISGSQVHSSSRLALLFVEQSIQDRVIDIFKKLLNKQFKSDAECSAEKSKCLWSIANRLTPAILKTGQSFYVEGGFPEACLIWNIGTNSPFAITESLGWKARSVLFILPYRNTAELIALSNSFGGINKTVSLFTSHPSVIQEVTTTFKALGGIWINMIPRQLIPPTHSNLGVVRKEAHDKDKTPEATASSSTAKIDWKQVTENAEKGFKAWTDLEFEVRNSKLAVAFRKCTKKLVPEEDPTKIDNDLLRLQFLVSTQCGDHLTRNQGVVAVRQRPYGVIGIIYHGPVPKDQIMKTILLALGKRSAVVAVFVESGSGDENRQWHEEWSADLPKGVLQFQSVKNITAALNGLAQEGKIPLVWVLHSSHEKSSDAAGDGSALREFSFTKEQIPKDAFSMVLVDDIETLDDRIKVRAAQLEIQTAIHFA